MKNFCAVFALFCVMFLFAACGSDSKESVYNDTDTSDSTSDKTDSDTTDTNSDDADSQSDSTADTTPDNGDSADDADTSDPADDADSSDSQSDDDADTSHGNEPEVGDTRESNCTGLPANAQWNTVSSITQTWNGNEWTPSTEATFSTTPSSTKCRFVCKENYSWNDSECVAETRSANCEGLPENAVWNTVSSITQTWDGDEWIPSSTGIYNKNPNSNECRFKCAENYNWNGSQCVAATRPADCTGLPDGAAWNTASSITQSWNGSEWIPALSGVYNEESSSGECRFVCKTNYNWSGSSCVAATKTSDCTNLPDNALWNNFSSISQTWDGEKWIPSTAGTFNETSNPNECRFVCKTNYSWNGISCAPNELHSVACTGKPDNAVWNSVSNITQTWNGNEWAPTTTATFSETPSTTECRFKCAANYNWNGSECAAGTQQTNCTGLPANAVWNTASSITQTWDGNEWTPSTAAVFSTTPSTSKCRFTCKENYSWNDSACVADTKSAICQNLPENAVWNTVSSITQTWDGEDWIPSANGSYNTNPSNRECRFKCATNYDWNGSQCVAASHSASCTGLPANASWNTASSITQTWNGNAWTPSTTGTYNETASTTECHFKCNTNYNWNNGSCVAATKNENCTGLPANAVWNTASSITQTWDGDEWIPSLNGTYNETPSSNECHYKCAANYNWNNGNCIAATQDANCDPKPANTVWNDGEGKGTFVQTWNGQKWLPASYPSSYSKTPATCAFVCATGYIWNNGTCETAPTQNANCTGLPLNASWNIVSSITQTYDGENWTPSSVGTYSTTLSTTECHFKCNNHYNWNGTLCAAATNTFECQDLPENAEWNSVESYVQTWNGEEWYPADTEAEYNEESSTTECRFVCKEHFTWDGNECVADTQTAECSTKPVNTVWNDEGLDGMFVQTWSGEEWLPATHAATFSNTPGECVFVCTTGYVWNGTKCATAPTQSANCRGLPANTQWNTVSSITQTWDGSKWLPTNVGVYDTNPSTTECHFKCNVNYSWNGEKCVADTKIDDCTDLPDNATWNTVSQISRTWNGSTWIPSKKGTYNETPSTTECHFVCNSQFTWEESTSTCVGDTQFSNCTGLPNNASWNTATRIRQTWNGTGWLPSTTGSYNEESSTTECRFKCNKDHFWNGSECINPCDAAPCDISHATGDCIPKGLTKYICECDENYYWWGENKGCINKRPSLGNICTGQNKCYNNSETIVCPTEGEDFYGQDAQYAEIGTCIPQRFKIETISGESIVKDINTGLMWQQNYPNTDYKWSEAFTYCSNLTLAKYSDWRLPTPQELVTISDIGKSDFIIDSTYFPIYQYRFNFWSSLKDLYNTTRYWYVSMMDPSLATRLSFVGSFTGTETLPVRCVRGENLSGSNLKISTSNGDTIVTDTNTGLIWQKTYAEERKTWQQALSYCENLTYAGYSDWRMPNRNELYSLINYEKYKPASDFPNIPTNNFWSSSSNGGNAEYVGIGYGDIVHEYYLETRSVLVICVRSE